MYRISRKYILAVVFLLATAFAWCQDTSFHEFVKTATPEEIREAINSGADVNARDEDGWTALMYAAYSNGNPDVINVLLDAGADIKARDDIGMTPLVYAARSNKNPDVIKVLLEAGADGKTRNDSGETAFDLAEENEHLKGTDAYWQLNDARF